MRILKLYILFVLISLIVGVGNAFSTPIEEFNIDEVMENQSIEVSEASDELTIDEIPEEETKVVEEPKTTPQEQTVSESRKTKQENKTISSNSKKEEPKVEQPKEEVKKIQPWEELGLSEDEYYNKPIMSWQKVTHANMDACKKEGQETVDDESNDFIGFWCYEVYSPSGKFLGAMLSLS